MATILSYDFYEPFKGGNGISSVVSSNNVLFLIHLVPIVYYESVCFILLHFLFLNLF